MMPQSPSKKQTPWDLTQFSQSPSAAPSYFPESHWWSEMSSLSKVILVLGKSRNCGVPNLGCRGSESPGWPDVLPIYSAPDVMHEQVCCCDKAANHQLPVAVSFGIIWIVSMEKCSSLIQNLMQICCSMSNILLILNVMATQCTCSLNGIYHPHWLAQFSCHCSHMCIARNFPWLPGYMNVVQNFPVILTVAALFLDILSSYVCVCVYLYLFYICKIKLTILIIFKNNHLLWYAFISSMSQMTEGLRFGTYQSNHKRSLNWMTCLPPFLTYARKLHAETLGTERSKQTNNIMTLVHTKIR